MAYDVVKVEVDLLVGREVEFQGKDRATRGRSWVVGRRREDQETIAGREAAEDFRLSFDRLLIVPQYCGLFHRRKQVQPPQPEPKRRVVHSTTFE